MDREASIPFSADARCLQFVAQEKIEKLPFLQLVPMTTSSLRVNCSTSERLLFQKPCRRLDRYTRLDQSCLTYVSRQEVHLEVI